MNKEYIEKLDQIISFFKDKKETDLSFIFMNIDNSKFYSSLFISLVALLIAFVSILLNMDIFSDNFIAIFIVTLLIFFTAYMISNYISSKRRTEKLIHRATNFNEIINYLQSLKIQSYQVDLFPLINVIKRYYQMDTIVDLSDRREYAYHTWYNEIIDCLNNINAEIIEKDNL